MSDDASITGNKKTAVEFLGLVIAGDIDEAYRKYAARDGRHHNLFFPAGFVALQKAMEEAHVQFPRKSFTVKHVIGEGDFVAVHSHLVLESGSPGYITLHIFRFSGGKIAELWDFSQGIPSEMPNADGPF